METGITNEPLRGPQPLLGQGEPAPCLCLPGTGTSPFLLACDHGDRLVPRRLGMLGITQDELDRHIGWDIGILEVSRRLAGTLGATLVAQRYSRLVVDCNRRPGMPSSMAEVSDGTVIPGNQVLTGAERSTRIATIFEPYHDALANEIDAHESSGRPLALVTMHSFTPALRQTGRQRPWHIGVLFNRDVRLGRSLFEVLSDESGLCVGENEPYAVSDPGDYTIPVHGEDRGILHVEIEIRQDLIGDAQGQDEWAARLARLLPQALARCGSGPGS